MKTDDGRITGKISSYCRALEVSRAAFYDYLDRKSKPWKYQPLADEMMKIHDEDKCNDCYGRERMYMALTQKKDSGKIKGYGKDRTYPQATQKAQWNHKS